MADEGASPRELVLEASRRNNTDLLESVLNDIKPVKQGQEKDEAVAELLNTARDGMGNTALHLAAKGGHLEILDLILDQPGVETDPRLPSTLETPLFSAVQFTNASSEAEGKEIVDILVDAGCDPRLRNKGKMKPVDLVDPRYKEVRDFLRRAELALTEGEGLVNEDEQVDDDEAAGPPTDSDDDA